MKQWLVRRGLLATLPVASLVLAFGACSAESGPTGTSGDTNPSSKVPQADGAELKVQPVAVNRIARLSQQFNRIQKQPAEPAPFNFPPGVTPPKPAPVRELLPAIPVLSKGDARSFIRQGERFRAEVDSALKGQAIRPATVDLPQNANGFVRVQPDGSL